MVAKSSKNAEIIRPILRGRDIKRYGYEFADLWLICTHNGTPTEPAIDIYNYPDVKAHLDKYYTQLSIRQDRGITPYNLRSCIYMDDFSKQKIMYPNMTKFLPFYLDDSGFYQNDKSFMITGSHIAFLTGFLNSSLFKYCFLDNFPELQGGTRELRKIFIEKIPVITIDNGINQIFQSIVNDIQTHRKAHKNSEILEKEIDNLIFDLYELTEKEREEIGFIQIR